VVRRVLLLAVVLTPAVLAAQQPPSTVPALPSIGLPLQPIGLPPPAVTPPSSRSREAHPHDRGHRAPQPTPWLVYAPGPYAWFDEWSAPAAEARRERPRSYEEGPRTGRLRVQVEPPDAQVFVDGTYAGTPGDANEIELAAGVHRLEIVAPGHESTAVDVHITAGERITYRGRLTAVPPPPSQRAPNDATRPGRVIYLLKDCYLGDVPPPPGSLPARCDLRQMITYPIADGLQ
jgi:hypothetical protein